MVDNWREELVMVVADWFALLYIYCGSLKSAQLSVARFSLALRLETGTSESL